VFGGSNGKLLSSNVHLDTHWAVRVVDARGKTYYFDFPQSQRDEAETSSNTSETWKWPSEAVQAITAEQVLGYTTYSPRKIEEICLHHLLIVICNITNISIRQQAPRMVGNAPLPLLAQPTFLYLPDVVDP
jgi:hypothetical protein